MDKFFARSWQPGVPSLREVYHARFDHAYPMHTHDAWTVMFVDEGAVSCDLDRGAHFATSSALTLLPPGVPHDGRSAEEGKAYRKRVLYLESDWLPNKAYGPVASLPTLNGTDPLSSARNVHVALRHPGNLLMAEHWLITLKDQILDRLSGPARIARDVPLARRLRVLLDDRFVESFTIAEVAAQLGAHPSHLTRAFSQA